MGPYYYGQTSFEAEEMNIGGIGGGLYRLFSGIGQLVYTVLVGSQVASKMRHSKPAMGGAFCGAVCGSFILLSLDTPDFPAGARFFLGAFFGALGGLVLAGILISIVMYAEAKDR